jgi:protein TonB
MRRSTLLRLALFLAAAAFHGLLLIFLVVYIEPAVHEPEPPLRVMKLIDPPEEPALPPPPPPRPPPPPQPPAAKRPVKAVEAAEATASIAETMTVVEELPEEPVAAAAPGLGLPGSGQAPSGSGQAASGQGEDEYLPMSRVSKQPQFSERALLDALIYPSVARRAGIGGRVLLELFIDKAGEIRRIDVIREEPAGRGFAEAAKKAFRGLRCIPAEANGIPVNVRYRYPVRFTMGQ